MDMAIYFIGVISTFLLCKFQNMFADSKAKEIEIEMAVLFSIFSWIGMFSTIAVIFIVNVRKISDYIIPPIIREWYEK